MSVHDFDRIYDAKVWSELADPAYHVMDYAPHPTDVFAGFAYATGEDKRPAWYSVKSENKRRRIIENVRRLYDSLPEEHRETALNLMLFSYQNGADLFCEL